MKCLTVLYMLIKLCDVGLFAHALSCIYTIIFNRIEFVALMCIIVFLGPSISLCIQYELL